MSDPIISHSEITDEIYIVCGTKKYNVTEQVIRAMRETGRLEQQRPHGEWIPDDFGDFFKSEKCSECGLRVALSGYNFCPNCGADMRPKEGEKNEKRT